MGQCQDELPPVDTSTTRSQTRFIPALGWCIHYGSKASQGGSYRIMFLDGVTLDVNVDEECVEFKDQAGDVSR
jgi:polo-like kinase 4